MFPSVHLPTLQNFSKAVWGNDQAIIKQSGDIEFIDLTEYLPAFKSLYAGAVHHDKILVREEYRMALAALETATYDNGAYVTGHSGIGKTLFSIYLLVKCLGKKRPVALQSPKGMPFYALFNDGQFSIQSIHDLDPLYECGYVWALSDSNAHVQSPSGTFVAEPEHIRVIQTTEPKATNWKGWSEQTNAQCYVMDIWSEKEVADLAVLLGLNVKRLRTLAEKWGGVPRNLLAWYDEDDTKIGNEVSSQAQLAIRQFRPLFAAIKQNDVVDDAASLIYFTRPWREDEDTEERDHTRSSVSIPTRAIAYVLGAEFASM